MKYIKISVIYFCLWIFLWYIWEGQRFGSIPKVILKPVGAQQVYSLIAKAAIPTWQTVDVLARETRCKEFIDSKTQLEVIRGRV